MELHFTGIRRDPLYSPGHIETDSMILMRTAEELRQRGHQVRILEEERLNGPVAAPLIFAMCQSLHGIRWLEMMAEAGSIVVNTPRAILNCYRVHLIERLAAAGVPMPATSMVSTSAETLELPEPLRSAQGLWLKRGDAHALDKNDVVRVESETQLRAGLRAFRERGIESAVVQQHVEGTLLKFYAVRETPFFRWYRHDPTQSAAVDEGRLHELARRSAEALGLDVYGGDVIVTAPDEIVVIDINDWPSFSACRNEAAPYIADRIVARAASTRNCMR